ncbi:MAG: energy transducer TonB [Dysgonomonas sp.]
MFPSSAKRFLTLFFFGMFLFSLSAQKSADPVSYPGGEKAFGKFFADNYHVSDWIKTSPVNNNEYNFSFWIGPRGNVTRLDQGEFDLPKEVRDQIVSVLLKTPAWTINCKKKDCPAEYRVSATLTFPDSTVSCKYTVLKTPKTLPEGTVEETPFDYAEEQPQFSGGDSQLTKYLNNNIRYPVISLENGVQGRVIIRFLVKKDGTVSNVRALRGIDPSCDKEAIRVVKSMPKWIPGKESGRIVPAYYNLPIEFKIIR